MGFFCRCCKAVSSTGDPPPPCDCCPGQTARIVNGICVCQPTRYCPDGRVQRPPDCDCLPRCPAPQCPDNSQARPWPVCCEAPVLPQVNCAACCPIGDESAACTPPMFLISIPDAQTNPLARCPPLPADVAAGCDGNTYLHQDNPRGCDNGGSYYLVCDRGKYLRYQLTLAADGCSSAYHEWLDLPATVQECCEWTFCKPAVSANLLAEPFCSTPAGCPFFARSDHNTWCYAPFISVRLAADGDGHFFSVAILVTGNCSSAGGLCYSTGAIFGERSLNGPVTIIGRTPSEPRPLNCFAQRTVPLTHWYTGSYWDPLSPPATPLPLTPQTWIGICSDGGNVNVISNCVFPAGLSATIVGLAA